mgnify:CR=1 FL=1
MEMADQNSLVSSSAQDQRYVGLRGAEQLGYVGLLHCAAKRSDLGYFGRGKQFLEGFDEPSIDGVLLVSSVISPFKIGEDVVGFVSVDVIDEGQASGVWNESECDKAMDETSRSFSFSKQGDLHVTEFMKGRLERLSIASLRPMPCFSHPVDASDSSKVAGLVEAFEARNGSPLFFNHDVASLQLLGMVDYIYTQTVVQ